MIIPTFNKCDKGHSLEIYHRAGDEWCLWCPKCHKTGYYDMNFFRWPILSKIDDIMEINLTNYYIKFKWFLARKLVGRHVSGTFIRKGKTYGECPICGAGLSLSRHETFS